MPDAAEVAASRIRAWREDPRVFVREVFGVTPDAWQDAVLGDFPHHQRQAMRACKGPGKTAVLAWLGWNFLLTRPHPKIAATSITGDNLRDNLWTEMAKWQARAPLLREMFTWRKERIEAKRHPETWWMAARTWPRSGDRDQQADTLAGLHADYVLFILDESGGIPRAVMAAADAALSSCVEGHIVQAGNPTHRDGPLYDASTREVRLWQNYSITGDPDDPLRSPRVRVEWAQEQIERYGRDNPWVLINVFGQFPPASINTLIGPDEMEAAQRRSYHQSDIAGAARIFGIDVARMGDDASVLFPRQGLVAFAPTAWRNLDGNQGSGAVAYRWREWGADAVFIDDTGGFGASWIDGLRRLGHSPVGVHFSGSPNDARYANKRAEMYFELVEWIRRGGQLPGCPELVQALTQTTYSFRGDRLILEDKAQLKDRIGMSPDHADALALTFAQPVAAKPQRVLPGTRLHKAEYNPYAIGAV